MKTCLGNVRKVIVDEECWYALKDVCELLKTPEHYGKYRSLISRKNIQVERIPQDKSSTSKVKTVRVLVINSKGIKELQNFLSQLKAEAEVSVLDENLDEIEVQDHLNSSICHGYDGEEDSCQYLSEDKGGEVPPHVLSSEFSLNLSFNSIFQEFEFELKEVRITVINDEPWVVLKDVCEVFGVKDYKEIKKRLYSDEVMLASFAHPQSDNNQIPTSVINESGLYHVLFTLQPHKTEYVTEELFQNRKKLLDRFRRWVTHEVLPSIRKTGSYSVQQTISPDLSLVQEQLQLVVQTHQTLIDQNQSLINQNKKLINQVTTLTQDYMKLKNQVEEWNDKVQYTKYGKKVEDPPKKLYTTEQLLEKLKKTYYSITPKKLFNFLYEEGVVDKKGYLLEQDSNEQPLWEEVGSITMWTEWGLRFCTNVYSLYQR